MVDVSTFGGRVVFGQVFRSGTGLVMEGEGRRELGGSPVISAINSPSSIKCISSSGGSGTQL